MTKKIVLSAIAASVMASSVMATNGDNLIATGAKARAMGGTQISNTFGAESTMYNPAMISGVKESLSASLTIFDATVTARNYGSAYGDNGAITSTTPVSAIPNVTYVKPINKELTVGMAVYGSAGMGVTYTDQAALFNMHTSLSLLKIAVPVAYKVSDALSVGFSPVLMRGALDIDLSTISSTNTDDAATDIGYGFELGLNFAINKELNVAALYKSAVSLSYASQVKPASASFGLGDGGAGYTDELEQPAEIGVGATYKMGKSTISADYKVIQWGNARGYQNFDWVDQTVIALGYELDGGDWKARLGYNKGDMPLSDTTNSAHDAFNLIGFPATSETHMTVGGSYDLSKALSLDVAVVISPETTSSFATSAAVTGASAAMNTHSETSYTVGANYNF